MFCLDKYEIDATNDQFQVLPELRYCHSQTEKVSASFIQSFESDKFQNKSLSAAQNGIQLLVWKFTLKLHQNRNYFRVPQLNMERHQILEYQHLTRPYQEHYRFVCENSKIEN